MSCLDDNDASEFVSGSLAGSALTKVESHLARCRDCRELVATLAGADANDSNADTRKHERIAEDSAMTRRPTRTLAIGDRVGRYLVLSTLGAGGMGVVFSAYDPQLDRKIALKLLRANLGGTAKEARARLKREAQAIAQLNHPNVVAVYDVGETDDGDVYVAMEFVEGDTLTTWLRRWPRTWREILDVFHQAARGLMAAHSVGLLHRDFKPDNVLVGGDGRVRVSDFGLARSVLGIDGAGPDIATAPSARPASHASPLLVDLTATGTVLGTPRYMAPEQLTGPDIDARSDQFSFCIALYEALFGTHPLPGATSASMLDSGARAIAPPEGSRVPSAIIKAVQRGLEKDRAKRFPTMAAMISELTPPPQRSPARFVTMAIAGVLLVGGATAAVLASRPGIKRIEPVDVPEVRVLQQRIIQLEKERKALQDQILQKEIDLKQIQVLKKELESRDEELQDLVVQLSTIRIEQKAAAAKPPPMTEDARISLVLQDAHVIHDLEGCFDEWAGRQGIAPLDGKSKPAPKLANLLVRLTINPDGVAHSALTTGEESPSLKFCVESAISRVHYPANKQVLDLSVAVLWADPNDVNTSAHVLGHHEAPTSTIDLP